jgi:hypothetical protein
MAFTPKAAPAMESRSNTVADERVFRDMMATVEMQAIELEDLRENMTDTIIAIDNIGWVPLNGDYVKGRGVPLDSLKRWAELNQQLLAINPLIKRGSNIRVSYIFGELIEFQKDTPACRRFREANEDLIFGQEALKEQEAALNTDGNLFHLLDKATGKVTRIPLSEITDIAVKPDSQEEKLFFERTWVVTKQATDTSADVAAGALTETRKRWYPAPDLDPQWNRRRINGVEVAKGQAILHTTSNKQIGWLYGVPDIQPAVFWAKAYKEFLEANYTLVRALAKFAFKMTANSAARAQRAGAKLAAPAPVNQYTGAPGVAGAVTLQAGEDFQAVNKAGANVNFEAGKPLASMVAAALEVNVIQLLSTDDTSSASDALDIPLIKAMQARQHVYDRMMRRMFAYFGFDKVKPKFPPIQWEPVHRVVQAITTAASTNGLWPEETRSLLVGVLRQYGIDPLAKLPDDGRNAEFVSGINAAEQAQQQADLAQQGIDNQAQAAQAKTAGTNTNAGTSPQKTPKGSSTAAKRSPAGATADGDNSQRKSQ